MSQNNERRTLYRLKGEKTWKNEHTCKNKGKISEYRRQGKSLNFRDREDWSSGDHFFKITKY